MFYSKEFLSTLHQLRMIIDAESKRAVEAERERCAKIAETVGLGEPHSMPPYSVREYIAKEIRGVDNEQ
jgi:hypothetical protein